MSFSPGADPPRAGETEVQFDEAPDTRLVAWCPGPLPCSTRPAAPRFRWFGRRLSTIEDRTVSASYVVATPGRRLLAILASALAGAALALIGGVLWARRRRRRRVT